MINRCIAVLAIKAKMMIIENKYGRYLMTSTKFQKTQRNSSKNASLQEAQGSQKLQCSQVNYSFLCIPQLLIALNNLVDLTHDPRFSTLFGFTPSDIKNNREISKYLAFIAQELSIRKKSTVTSDDVLNQLAEFYDGYKFYADAENCSELVLCPFTFMNYLADASVAPSSLIATINGITSLEMRKYWFETGTTSIIQSSLKDYPVELFSLDEGSVHISKAMLNSSCEALEYLKQPTLHLFHAGYLTIESYVKDKAEYKLKFPNLEVTSAFQDDLLKYKKFLYTDDLADFLGSCRYHKFYEAIQTLFTKQKPQAHNEDFYHCHVFHYIDFKKKEGEKTGTEKYITSEKRADIVYLQKNMLYIIELKYDSHSESDLEGTAEKRKYLQLAASKDSTLWKNMRIAKPKSPLIYRSIDMAFNNDNIYQMEVRELLSDKKNTKKVYPLIQAQALIKFISNLHLRHFNIESRSCRITFCYPWYLINPDISAICNKKNSQHTQAYEKTLLLTIHIISLWYFVS
eukprot:TRINITY_DN856_c0_g1_i1.p1 TRINITY_DN856_c0_g1~~TRINITY_DN856_c0_g1_i1.p1  ORF type:complete len:515 (-),score=12.73 TRINITY_DN856_c0_g1_i1:348-1892(-)